MTALIKRILLPVLLVILSYLFWLSDNLTQICAGVAIFLFGMLSLEEGFKAFTGGVLERVLQKTTDTLPKSMAFGVATTTLMQSSSLISVLTISFLSAGLLSLSQGIGIIFGANLGTTTGAWLVAGFGLKVNISAYAMPLLVFGAVLVLQRNKKWQGLGYIFAGIGFLFLGIHHMKEGFDAFRDQIDLTQYAIPGFKGLLIYTLLGIVATVVMQSSHATLVLTITALSSGQITYTNALALAIGANVGTTITAILGALSANVEGKRLAFAHVIFNVSTGLLTLLIIVPLQHTVDWVSAALAIADDDYTLKLSVFHTLFNLMGILIMIPFTATLVTKLETWLPDKNRRAELRLPVNKTDERVEVVKAQYLNASAKLYPDTAIQALIQEVRHLYSNTLEVVLRGMSIPRDLVESSKADLSHELPEIRGQEQFHGIEDLYERYIKQLYAEIMEFASSVQAGLTPNQSVLLVQLLSACQKLIESVKASKHLNKNLIHFIESDNPWVVEQYNNFRIRIAECIRELLRLQQFEKGHDLLTCDRIRIYAEQADLIKNGDLFKIIRAGHIPGAVSGSLLKDGHYSSQIISALVDSAEIIMKSVSAGVDPAEMELNLAVDEIEELARNKHQG
ncbi:Na/Pi cotransporter family protein [Oleiphilus messinensis]|uniref:Na/Pi cotransporter family protein n=1 Tax=Oleiphilus messinensis TaxID=141451 RepID=UPI0018DF4CC2|nr:Na/Pi symporter [Oleiphilus messinensis]